MRQRETMCPACDRIVGTHVWNQTWGDKPRNPRLTETVIWKVTRHHNRSANWCLGSGMSVPEGAVIPVRVGA